MYYFIYPSKDAYIYELNTNSEKNFGGDNNLILKKDFDGGNGLNGVSRVLLHFDLNELSQSLVSGEITSSMDGDGLSPKYYLRLYEQKTSELSPTYSLATFPLTQNWEDGSGYTTQDPNSRNGVSWERSDESFDYTTWSANTSLINAVKNSGSLLFTAASSQNVSLGTNSLFSSAEASFTFWIKPTTLGEHNIFAKDEYSGDIAIRLTSSDQIRWYGKADSTDSQTSSTTLSVGTWQHIAMTFDGTTAKIYINGVEDVSTTKSDWAFNGGSINSNQAWLGRDTGGNYLNSNLDEFAIFSKGLSASEVTKIYNDGKPTDLSNESNLVAYYRFEETSGTTATDLSSNSNNGTLSDAAMRRADAPYSQSFTDTTLLIDTGSRSVTGGGIWYRYSGECSQSFSYESPDVNMDVTDIVNNWLNGTVPNNGLILKWSGSQENSTDISGDINFFSSNANSIYSPKIEVRWDEQTNDYTGTFEDYEEEFNDGTGTFLYPDVVIDPVTIDGTDDNYMFMIGLRKTYRETEKPRFRVAGRERYITKTVSTTKSTITNKLVPHGSGSYSIIDVETGATLIPFGDYSVLSTDTYSNYFKLKLDGFINNRLYRVLLRLRLNDGRYRIFDDGWEFKVVK